MVVATHRLPSTPCPSCKTEITAASNMEGGSGPQPGDLTVCIECATVLTFTEDLQLRELAYPEVLALRTTEVWPDLLKKRQAVLALHRSRK